MNFRTRFLLPTLFSAFALLGTYAQQQPVLTVEITKIAVVDAETDVVLINVTAGGNGYISVPRVVIAPPDRPGVQAEAVAYIEDGELVGIDVTEGGSGYSRPPVVTIVGGGGAGADAVAITGSFFSPPNESFGAARKTIGITAQALGSFVDKSYTYTFYVNGISIGKTPNPVPPTAPPPTAFWTPPQPGSYFLTVTATDEMSTFTSLAVRYFATGTTVESPLTNTLVPQGSAVVIQGDATPAQGFVREIQFFDNGVPIGVPDQTLPYSVLYRVPGGVGSIHNITAQATTNDRSVLPLSVPAVLRVVDAITPLPTSKISTPANKAYIPVPLGTPPLPIKVTVDATSRPGGRIDKVELYIDGVLSGTKNSFPYSFDWMPTVVGRYELVALTYDDKRNVIASDISTVGIMAPPSVAITNPSNSAAINEGVPVKLSAAASDSNVDVDGAPFTISSVQFFVDNTYVGTAGSPDSDGIYTVTGTLTQKVDQDGNVLPSYITAIATNSKGGTTVSVAVRVSVNKGAGGGSTIGDAPTVDVSWPAAGTQLPVNKPVLIAARAGDTDGNIVSVQFVANQTIIGSTTTYPYNVTWTPRSLGLYKLVAITADSDGNMVTSTPVNVTVLDPAPNPPVVSIATPASGSSIGVGSTQTLRATATDAVSVANVQFFVNGTAHGSADTSWPFEGTWSPVTPGIYTITARAMNASGNQTTSPAVMVIVSETAGDAVYTGTYGVAESGRFALIAGAQRAAFIAYSTTPGVSKTYRYLDIPVNVSGGYALVNPSGSTVISGLASAAGTNGSFDSRQLRFIGFDTRHFPASRPVANGYYTGTLGSRAGSSLTALVGVDGSIMLHAADGTFDDAGSGTVDATGSFNVGSVRGNRFTGTVDPATRLLTGSLTGSKGGAFSASIGALGESTASKVMGFAAEVGSNIYVAATDRTYDQVLLQGVTATITADPGQVTRISYVDLSNDIVQVEFAGAGKLSITLDNPSGPAAPVNYSQPGVAYMKGHAKIVITGADETTNVSVFSVGRQNAGNQSLFKENITYDGVADLGHVAILSNTGKFGGVRTANASYVASTGIAGVCAPGVQMTGPVYIGDITASDTANPMVLLGASNTVQINGGDLWQANDRPVQVSGVSQLAFVDGTTSHGVFLPAQTDKSRLEQEGADVTTQIVVNPTR